MRGKARRLPLRRLRLVARRVLLALCLWSAGVQMASACRSAEQVTRGEVEGTRTTWQAGNGPQLSIWYADLTSRYGHGVLGDALEPETLVVYSGLLSAECGHRVTLSPPHVFEDTAPRFADLDRDGWPEIITVRSHDTLGAQIAVYAIEKKQHTLSLLTTTPYIGTRFRWLAPLGAADLDGDGKIEIAYVDRPHLAKTVRVWRFENNELTEVAAVPGFTNHRIGQVDIAGGIRDCGQGPEMILATANWAQLVSLRYEGAEISGRTLGRDTSRPAFASAMACSSR